MKVKTAELTGLALDWAVAKCEGIELYGPSDFKERRTRSVKNGEFLYRYHQSWAQGGPIIEREMIMFQSTGEAGVMAYFRSRGTSGVTAYGPTHLIAAMRLVVAAKMGDEVEIPEELL